MRQMAPLDRRVRECAPHCLLADVNIMTIITGRVCARAIGLPPSYPKDPADCIIGATALVEGLSLLTADREIHKSEVLRTIW
jgi:PIN domain nuclease of toxin-antitoxin system